MAIQLDPKCGGKTADEVVPKHRLQAVVMLVLLFSALLFAWIGGIAEDQDAPADIIVRTIKVKRNDVSDGICLDICKARKTAQVALFQSKNIMDRQDLLELAMQAKRNLVSKLKVDYGEYFEKIFRDPAAEDKSEMRFRGFDPITPDGESTNRLKRKLQIKALQVQTTIQQQEANVHGLCNCHTNKALVDKIRNVTAESMNVDATYINYVWATGGHSASAGHGNLYNESYTAFMERGVKNVFGAIGIEFEARNYAMGGTGSGLEVSMCWEQIFGSDVDFFSWDYGMTDGNYVAGLLHYGYRGGISPGFPAFAAIHCGGRSRTSREDRLKDMEQMGMSAFIGSEPTQKLIADEIPNSAGISDAEIAKMPDFVRNFKCGEQLETGDPYCRSEKYTKAICAGRAKQVSWHPGIKYHALDGNLLALFLAQTLTDALRDLANHTNTDAENLLAELKKEEEELHNNLRTADLPDITKFAHNQVGKGETPDDDWKELDAELKTIWQGPSLCKTGRLPAMSRYLGYTTNSSKVAGFAVLGEEKYDIGLILNEAKQADAMNGEMKLVWEPGGREREQCPVVLKPDYKDFFYAHQVHGSVQLTIPNEKEKEAYGYDQAKFKGIFFIYFGACDWGKCAAGDLQEDAFLNDKFAITVNGEKVIRLVNFGGHGIALRGNDGFQWKPSVNNDYQVVFTVKEANSFVRLQSIVLY